ncbi:hypothetical protein [Methanobrevibacter sp.]|uniref:hypothetical protein n=1 Tax=Methanobrevibacter sp. TaxID=66852 RepID=UPI00388DE957
MPKFEISCLCGPKVCADCKRKFYGCGYVKGYIRPPKDIFEEVFCITEIVICYSCYQKYKEEAGE